MTQQISEKKKPRTSVIRCAVVFALGFAVTSCSSEAEFIRIQTGLDRLDQLKCQMSQLEAEGLQWRETSTMKEVMQDRELLCALGEYYEIIQKKLKRKTEPEKLKRYFDLKNKGECVSRANLSIDPFPSVKELKRIIAPAPNRTEVSTLDQNHSKKKKSKKLDSTKQAAEILEEFFREDDSLSKKGAKLQTPQGRILNPM